MVKGAKRGKGKLAFHAFRPPSPVIRVIRVIRGSFNLLPRERLRKKSPVATRGRRALVYLVFESKPPTAVSLDP
jgi:hypothetical protein